MSDGFSRRDLFGIFRKSFDPPTKEALPLRPPGAIAEDRIADTCIRCGACVDACPRRAIRPIAKGRAAGVGTPHIVAREAPCVVCAGLNCTHVCPSGTLRPVAQAGDIMMGLAVVNLATCLPHQGQPCNTCVSFCPIPGALTGSPEGHPKVSALCIGCGLCENLCPTQPASIQVRPRSMLKAPTG